MRPHRSERCFLAAKTGRPFEFEKFQKNVNFFVLHPGFHVEFQFWLSLLLFSYFDFFFFVLVCTFKMPNEFNFKAQCLILQDTHF